VFKDKVKGATEQHRAMAHRFPPAALTGEGLNGRNLPANGALSPREDNSKEVTMRTISVAAIALVLAASGALAQNPPANDGPNNKAINSKNGNNPGAPVAGANSFTEGQAKSRIESKGFSNVSGLKKDDKGVWRGTAMRDGKSVDVSLDFEGNVVAR
jgi:hypothetical protein